MGVELALGASVLGAAAFLTAGFAAGFLAAAGFAAGLAAGLAALGLVTFLVGVFLALGAAACTGGKGRAPQFRAAGKMAAGREISGNRGFC